MCIDLYLHVLLGFFLQQLSAVLGARGKENVVLWDLSQSVSAARSPVKTC